MKEKLEIAIPILIAGVVVMGIIISILKSKNKML